MRGAAGPGLKANGVDYLRDPEAIYKKSFATIGAEADLKRFSPPEQVLAIRLIHACGILDIVDDLVISPEAISAGTEALARGAAVISDVSMVQNGIIRRNLPADNPLLCGLEEKGALSFAKANGTTRSAGGVEALANKIPNSIIAVGNAPTALFHLLEMLDDGLEKPALILGFPVGFVGAAESKAELINNSRGVPFIALKGRRGGSALAAAAVNALAFGLST